MISAQGRSSNTTPVSITSWSSGYGCCLASVCGFQSHSGQLCFGFVKSLISSPHTSFCKHSSVCWHHHTVESQYVEASLRWFQSKITPVLNEWLWKCLQHRVMIMFPVNTMDFRSASRTPTLRNAVCMFFRYSKYHNTLASTHTTCLGMKCKVSVNPARYTLGTHHDLCSRSLHRPVKCPSQWESTSNTEYYFTPSFSILTLQMASSYWLCTLETRCESMDAI